MSLGPKHICELAIIQDTKCLGRLRLWCGALVEALCGESLLNPDEHFMNGPVV
jgi:hypothetical protein